MDGPEQNKDESPQVIATEASSSDRPALRLVTRLDGPALTTIERRQLQQMQRQAWELRVSGVDIHDIADKFGVEVSVARRWIREREKTEAANESRSVKVKRAAAVARAERVLMHAHALMMGEKVPLIIRVEAQKNALKATDQINKLEGNYAPTKVASTTPDGDRWAPFNAIAMNLPTEELQALKRINDKLLLADVVEGEVADDEETGT